MVVSTLLVLAVSSGGLFPQSSRSPRRSYEEYLRAGELASKVRAGEVLAASSADLESLRAALAELEKNLGQGRHAPEERKELEAKRRALRERVAFVEPIANLTRLGKAQHLVPAYEPIHRLLLAGNERPLAQAQDAIWRASSDSPKTTLARVTILGSQVAYAHAAKGDTARASDILVGLWQMMVRSGRYSAWDSMVASSMNPILLRQIQALTPRLSILDLAKLRSTVDQTLAMPLPVGNALAAEALAMGRELDELLAEEPEDFELMFVTESDQELSAETTRAKRMGLRFGQLSPAERRRTIERAKNLASDAMTKRQAHLQEPESMWFADPPKVTSGDELADFLLEYVMVVDWVREAQVIERVQHRILRLHLRLAEYEWEHGKAPSTLAEVAPDHERIDPLSGEEFRLERREGKLRVFSPGLTSTGEIDLSTYSQAARSTHLPSVS